MSTRTARHDDPTTFEDVAKMDPDSEAGELSAGKWVPVTKNTWRHGRILLNVGSLVREYIRRNPGWSASGGDPGTKLAHEPDTLRGPDVGIVRKDRLPTGKGVDGWLEGAPDVAVEILGDAQSITELIKKAMEYLRGGAKAVWILEPDPQRVLVITPPSHIRVIDADGTLDGEDALPGFRCQVSELFEEW